MAGGNKNAKGRPKRDDLRKIPRTVTRYPDSDLRPSSIDPRRKLAVDIWFGQTRRSWRQAFLQAGFSEWAANHHKEILADPNVVEYRNQKAEELLAAKGISAAAIVEGMANIANFDFHQMLDEEGNFLPLHEIDTATVAAIKSVDVRVEKIDGEEVARVIKITSWDKIDASKWIMDRLTGVLPNVNVNVNMTEDEMRAKALRLIQPAVEALLAEKLENQERILRARWKIDELPEPTTKS
jgi:terminase small subunit-like protein